MKIKVTKKSVRNNYSKIITVGYCDMQDLLRYHHAESYCTRIEGWACDNYDMGNAVVISTGYSPIDGIRLEYSQIVTAERKAQKIWSNKWHFNRQKAEVEKLLRKLIESAV